MLADTAYGSDENVRLAETLNVELVSPVAGPKGEAKAAATAATADAAPALEPLSIDDFAVDERTGQVKACPSGKIPLQVLCDAKSQTTTIAMQPEDCQACSFFAACPMQKKGAKFEMSYTDKQRRLEERRREQQTEPFQERYAKRSGMESTNSGLKRRQGLGELRIRGMKAVAHCAVLACRGLESASGNAIGGSAGENPGILAQRGLLGRFFARWFGWTRKSVAHWPTRPTQSPTLKLDPSC